MSPKTIQNQLKHDQKILNNQAEIHQTNIKNPSNIHHQQSIKNPQKIDPGGPSGASWVCVGGGWFLLGALFGPSWGLFGPSWVSLGPSWALLGRSWGGLGRSSCVSLPVFAVFLGLLVLFLQFLPSTCRLLSIFGPLGLDFRRFFSIFRDPAVTSLPSGIAEKT